MTPHGTYFFSTAVCNVVSPRALKGFLLVVPSSTAFSKNARANRNRCRSVLLPIPLTSPGSNLVLPSSIDHRQNSLPSSTFIVLTSMSTRKSIRFFLCLMDSVAKLPMFLQCCVTGLLCSLHTAATGYLTSCWYLSAQESINAEEIVLIQCIAAMPFVIIGNLLRLYVKTNHLLIADMNPAL